MSCPEDCSCRSAFEYRLHPRIILPKLSLVQAGVEAAQPQQLRMGAFLDDPATINNDQAVGTAHRAQAVGDDQRGATHQQLPECVLDQALALRVQIAWRCPPESLIPRSPTRVS